MVNIERLDQPFTSEAHSPPASVISTSGGPKMPNHRFRSKLHIQSDDAGLRQLVQRHRSRASPRAFSLLAIPDVEAVLKDALVEALRTVE